MNKSYIELIKLKTFEERFRYLQIGGKVADETFACHRYLNQKLYTSSFWKNVVRPRIIIRDSWNNEPRDLGIRDRPIAKRIIIHHINPITLDDITHNSKCLTDPNNLISCDYDTHQAIHYGDENLLYIDNIRSKGDTIPWKINI